MTLDHSALWSMYASLEELRGKIGHVLGCAIQRSKVAWSNVIAKRCRMSRRVKCSRTCDEYIISTLSLGNGSPDFKSHLMSDSAYKSSVTYPFCPFLLPAPISRYIDLFLFTSRLT